MDKYEVQRVVGQGSYGKAILCRRKKDSRQCIIKQISIAKLSRKEAKMTEQEAALLHRLQHPNIVTFWESFLAGSNLHIVMEFADGGDLESYIKNYIRTSRGREMPETQVLNLFVQLCLAIKHIHDRKILHRDLKCQNVFMTSSGVLKLGDFGVSRVLRNTVELAATQIGTPYYMSPEIMNNQKYNSKTDVWSLGIILYELVCLRLPFQGSSMKQLVYNIVNATPAPPSSVYSKEMRDLVRDILIKDPKKRPGINNILARPIMKGRIQNFLNETKMQQEFCHTILHGMNVLNAQPAAVPSATPNAAGIRPAPAPAPTPVSAQPMANPLIPKPLQQAPVIQKPAVQQAPPAQRPPQYGAQPPSSQQQQPVNRNPAQLERPPSQQKLVVKAPPAAPVAKREEAIKQQVAPSRPVSQQDAKRAPPPEIPQRIQEIIAKMMKQPVVNNPPASVQLAPKANVISKPVENIAVARPQAVISKPPVPVVYKPVEKRPESAPVVSKPPSRPSSANNKAPVPYQNRDASNMPVKVPVPVRKPEEKKDAIPSPFEAIVGRQIKPAAAAPIVQAAPPIVRPKDIIVKEAPSQQVNNDRRNSDAVVMAKKEPPAKLQSAASDPNLLQPKRQNPADRLRDLDLAMGKAAAVLDVIKQEREKRPVAITPPPSSEPAPKVAVNEPVVQQKLTPAADVSPKVDQPWLLNLNNQMGALKVQMQQIQASKTPQSEQVRPSPAGFPVAQSSESEKSKFEAFQVGNKAAVSANNAGGRAQRLSFPIAQKDPTSAAMKAVSKQQATPSAAKPKSNISPKPSSNALVKPSAAAGNRRLSDPMSHQPSKFKIDVKAPSKKAVTPTPDSKESLEQRKDLRQKHQMGFKEFLKAQKDAKLKQDSHFEGDEDPDMESAEFEPEQLQGGPSVASAARLSPRANPPFSKQPSNSKLGTDNRDYSSPIPTDDSQSSDKKRKSGGASSISKSLAAEELRNQYDSDRANLRKMINDKRKQTPQQDAEVVIVANQDYDDFVETHKQRYSNAAAHPPSTQVTPQPSISPQPSVTPRRDENSVQNVQNKESQLVLESIDSHGSPPNNKEMSNTMRLNASVAFDNCCNLWSKMVPAANAKIVPASPISRRQMAFELEEEAGDEGSVVLAQDSKSVAEAAVDETFEEAGFEESFEGDESYLGQSFVTELNGNAFENLANPQAALEYSMMLQQMQEILQLPSHPNIGAKALEKIEEGSEEEDIEEGFEEESVKFDLSDSDDDEGHAHGQDFEIEGEDEVEKNNESLEEIEPLVDEGGDPFVAAIRGNAFTRTMSEQLQMEQIKDESANVVTKVTEQSFASQLQQKLIEALGEVKFRKGMEFLLGSTMLADEMVNEDHLLDMIEEIIGIENLQYLEDMYQLLTYSNAR